MKTAEELFLRHCKELRTEQGSFEIGLVLNEFREALTEHDKEIVDKIDEKEKNGFSVGMTVYQCKISSDYWKGYHKALTELKQYIKEQR